MGVMRSNDAGLHWSAPVQIAPIRTAQLFVPDDNFPIRAEDYLPDIAIDPISGAIYVVWSDGLGTPINRVVMAKSTDGGRHWSGPDRGVGRRPERAGLQPRDRGHREAARWCWPTTTTATTSSATASPPPTSGCATPTTAAKTWEPEQHLHGPFDHYKAPISYFAPGDPRGLFLGDYIGLETTTGNNVIAFFPSTISDGADVWSRVASHS